MRRSYDKLFALENSIFESGLVNALVMLCSNLEMDLKCKPNVDQVRTSHRVCLVKMRKK